MVFEVKAGEGRLIIGLLLHSLFMGISLVFFETAATTLFLARFHSDKLPWVFIGAACAVPLSGVFYNKLRNKVSTPRLWIGTLVFLIALPLAMTPILYASTAAWPTLILMMLVNVLYALTALEFWGVAGRALDLRQARRLYGLVGSGEVAAGIIGGVAVGPALNFVSVTNLLLAAAAGFLICLSILVDLLRMRRHAADEEQDDEEEANQSIFGLLKSVVNDRYIMLFVGLYLFYNLTHETLEYTNLSQIQAHFQQNEKNVAVFIGGLLSVREMVTLTARTLFSGWMLNRFGLGVGLTATPVLMMAGSLGIIGVSLAMPNLPLFWFVVFLKIAEGSVRNSLGKPALMVAYRPLSPQRRDRAQMVVETAIEPLSTGLAGVILLVVNFMLEGAGTAQKAVGTGFILFTTACGWLAMGWLLRQDYTKVVIAALSRGTLRAAVLSLDEPTIAMLAQRLRSGGAGEAIYLLKAMQENTTPARLSVVLSGLLDHPDSDVRTAVLTRIEDLRLWRFVPALMARIETERVPRVRAAQLRALAACGDVDVIGEITPALRDPDPLMRRSALAGLLKYGGVSGVLQAGEQLLEMLHAHEPAERIMAAELVGDVGIHSFYHPLRQLLMDSDSAVRVAALEAAGQLRHDRLWPNVASHLDLPEFWQAASRSLTAGGDSATVVLEGLIETGGASRKTRTRAIRVLGKIASPAAVQVLERCMARQETRADAIQALLDCRYRAAGEAATAVDENFQREAKRAAGLNAAMVDVAAYEPATVLRETLKLELARSRHVMFSLLAFLYDADSLRQARIFWLRGSGEKKALALEVLDNLCDRRHKTLILPLVEDLTPGALRRKFDKHFPEPLYGAEARLTGILTTPPDWSTTWIRVGAAYALQGSSTPEARSLLTPLLHDADVLVGEAARVVLRQKQGAGEEDGSMLLKIEKVLLLKSVEFFQSTSDQTLVELAELVTEVRVKAGETIVSKGKTEASLYVIAEGEAVVLDGAKILATLREHSVFGELAALDPQPRTRDVNARTDLLLLRIDHATIVDLMAENIDVAHGVIRFLIRRYRPSETP